MLRMASDNSERETMVYHCGSERLGIVGAGEAVSFVEGFPTLYDLPSEPSFRANWFAHPQVKMKGAVRYWWNWALNYSPITNGRTAI